MPVKHMYNEEPSIEDKPKIEPTQPIEVTQNINESISNDNSNPKDSGVRGLSEAEMNDPNSIQVNIADPRAPLVILFGPPACGKTMTLVRMTRFLQSEGYTVSPIRTFRPTYNSNHSKICENFNESINSNNAAKSTNRIDFMLVEIIKNSRRICQILEAPGEYYHNVQNPNAGSPNYVNTIISSSNRKVWAIMVEPDWMDQTDRANYVRKITTLKQSMR